MIDTNLLYYLIAVSDAGTPCISDPGVSIIKLAIEKMGKRTVGVLSTESENQMHSYVSKRLTWCDAYQNQLNSLNFPE